MNCPECNHPIEEHSDIGCGHAYKNRRVCKCDMTDDEIELDDLRGNYTRIVKANAELAKLNADLQVELAEAREALSAVAAHYQPEVYDRWDGNEKEEYYIPIYIFRNAHKFLKEHKEETHG